MGDRDIGSKGAAPLSILRRDLLTGGAVMLGVGGLAAALSGDRRRTVGDLARAGRKSEPRDLGDGFVMVDGWVLKASDVTNMKQRR